MKRTFRLAAEEGGSDLFLPVDPAKVGYALTDAQGKILGDPTHPIVPFDEARSAAFAFAADRDVWTPVILWGVPRQRSLASQPRKWVELRRVTKLDVQRLQKARAGAEKAR